MGNSGTAAGVRSSEPTNGIGTMANHARTITATDATGSLAFAWLIFLVAVSFNAYDAYLRVTPSVTSEQLNSALGIDARTLGQLMTFYFVPFVLLQIPVGLLIDRLGAR